MKKDIRIYKYKDSNVIHLNNNIYDKSRIDDIKKSIDGKTLSYYENKKINPPILLYANGKYENLESFSDYQNAYISLAYFKLFR